MHPYSSAVATCVTLRSHVEGPATVRGPAPVRVVLAGFGGGAEMLGSGSVRSKKGAEQNAAEVAWTELSRRANAVRSSEVKPARPGADDSGQLYSELIVQGEGERVNRQDA